MDIVMRGVRGSIATPTPETSFYGGNTACLEVRADSGLKLFLDAGTGLRSAWPNPPFNGEAHIFLTHGHADHIIGLWFFKPLHMPGWTTNLYLPEWLTHLPDYFYQCGFFPVPFDQLKGRVIRHPVKGGDRLTLSPEVVVEAFQAHHSGGGLGYRVLTDDSVFVYTGDYEILPGEAAKKAAEDLLRGADLAVVDAQYNLADYMRGYGHSTWEDWLEAAARAGIKRLVLTHHDPTRSDQELDKLDDSLSELAYSEGLKVQVGREGLRLVLGGTTRAMPRKPDRLFQYLEEVSAYRYESAVLDRVLTKARDITRADAGAIFLVEGDELVLAYTHNDSLFSADEAHRHAYDNHRLPLDETSIAGYVAVNGQHLNLLDVRAIPDWAPYRYNADLDQATGYITVSMLALPFINSSGQTLGVMQLLNSLDPLYRTPSPFSLDMERYSRVLAREVSGILARSAMERSGIFGILRVGTGHDPFETGHHAERVGAIASEIFHVWAARHGHTPKAIRHEKGRLRLAAMLHDIGKVGLSDLLLMKKEGAFTPEEIIAMRDHTRLGASILDNDPGEIATLAREIALHHHQRWDGQGYAGSTDEGRLAGKDIPLMARITALADVFDALISKRSYKDPWTFEEAFAYMREAAGSHFDPELVDCLEEVGDLLPLIFKRFPDKFSEK